ncbi:MAG: HU family DNA-binding protein [Elainella sp. Prado103]|jgi:nucleoid DNA-binding protein|nr:HU family DNA-binding protein [Elainella sp. Prado103]
MMKNKELIEKVAAELGLPKGKARKAVDLVLMTLVNNGLEGEEFVSPIAKVTTKTIPAKSVHDEQTGQTKEVPERKQLVLRPTKKYLETLAS